MPPGKGAFVGDSQDPLPLGDPPSEVIRPTGAFVLHSVRVPLVPAFGAWISTTFTVAESAEQGPVPATT